MILPKKKRKQFRNTNVALLLEKWFWDLFVLRSVFKQKCMCVAYCLQTVGSSSVLKMFFVPNKFRNMIENGGPNKGITIEAFGVHGVVF